MINDFSSGACLTQLGPIKSKNQISNISYDFFTGACLTKRSLIKYK